MGGRGTNSEREKGRRERKRRTPKVISEAMIFKTWHKFKPTAPKKYKLSVSVLVLVLLLMLVQLLLTLRAAILRFDASPSIRNKEARTKNAAYTGERSLFYATVAWHLSLNLHNVLLIGCGPIKSASSIDTPRCVFYLQGRRVEHPLTLHEVEVGRLRGGERLLARDEGVFLGAILCLQHQQDLLGGDPFVRLRCPVCVVRFTP